MNHSIFFIAGCVLGILGGFLVVRKIYEGNQYDERQKLQRGESALHTMIFGIALLSIGSVMSEFFRPWLTVATQNILIVLLMIGFFVVEQICRGAYFGVNFNGTQLQAFCTTGAVSLLLGLVQVWKLLDEGFYVIKAGDFTQDGFLLVTYWWIVVIVAFALLSRSRRR